MADLELDFTVDEHHFGKRRKVSLTMDGEKILVTKGNVDVYISLYIEHYLRRNADTSLAVRQCFRCLDLNFRIGT